MKALSIYVLLAVSFFVNVQNKNTYTFVQHSSKDSIPSDTSLIDFNTQIKPIFESHCTPCHFTGGKMYERLPFDRDTTILNHGAGILRRIKDEQEGELIKQYIQQQHK
jgi:hypothetical protein